MLASRQSSAGVIAHLIIRKDQIEAYEGFINRIRVSFKIYIYIYIYICWIIVQQIVLISHVMNSNSNTTAFIKATKKGSCYQFGFTVDSSDSVVDLWLFFNRIMHVIVSHRLCKTLKHLRWLDMLVQSHRNSSFARG